ncbi:MAG: c-type cytochrome biogenesis protein CcsB [bacterium]
MKLDILFFNISFILYLFAIIHNFIFTAVRKEKIFLLGYGSVIAGFLFHSASIISRFIISGYIPFTNSYESLVFFAWTLVIIYLVFALKYEFEILGSFILPIIFLCYFCAMLFPKGINPFPVVMNSPWLNFHIIMSFFGYATFALAFSTGLMYILQEHYVKARKPAPFYYLLPSLDILDELNSKLVSIGFLLFTISIISGALWAHKVWGFYWNWDPKVMGALVTWLIYVIYLICRHVYGWRGKKVAYLSALGFWSAIIIYVIISFLKMGM